MGTFTEVVLGFSFRADAPDHVIAAFSGLVPPDERAALPGLPPPHDVDEDFGDWEPTDEISDPASDPEPWRHDWAGWLAQSMSVSIVPHSQLVRSELDRWAVTCRWGMKSWPESILAALQWLGPYLEGHPDGPELLGYMQYGGAPRPFLVWLTPQATLELEDLNPDGSY